MTKSRRFINAEAMAHSMKLRQMGGNLTVINSKLCYVTFDINGIEIKYVYNLNKHNKFFLERIKPYPRPIKEYNTEEDVIEVINIDIEQFKNIKSKEKLLEFIEISNNMNRLIAKYEDLFLYFDVCEPSLGDIKASIDQIEKQIDQTKTTCIRIYHRKDPDSL